MQDNIDKKIKEFASRETIRVPKGFDERMERIKMSLPQERQVHKAKRFPMRAAVILAAVLVLCLTIPVVAEQMNLNQIFKNIFMKPSEEPKMAPDTAAEGKAPAMEPVEADHPFLTQAGSILFQKVENAGLSFTARGIVGDGNSLYLAFDVETLDGQPFEGETEEKVKQFLFGEIYMQLDGASMGQYCGAARIDDGSVPGKATFLIKETLRFEGVDSVAGHQLKISIKDLRVSDDSLKVFDMEDLASLSKNFSEVTPDDYLEWGATESEGPDGVKDRHTIYLLNRAGKKLKFCDTYPEMEIDNMAFIDGDLYLNLNLNGAVNPNDLSDMNVVNRKNGEILSVHGSGFNAVNLDTFEGLDTSVGSDYENGEQIGTRVQFIGLGSPEKLKDAVLALGGTGSYRTVYQGSWEFEFPLDYEDTSVVYEDMNQVLSNGIEVEQMTLSPISMKLTMKTDVDSFEDMALELDDGSRIALDDLQWDRKDGVVLFQTMYPAVVETGRIRAVVINGERLALSGDQTI